uniref:Uncharacterized protein n=1 Tax=Arundo donax TaxID=35708 RepID=A0A0A8YMD1_ARUDO
MHAVPTQLTHYPLLDTAFEDVLSSPAFVDVVVDVTPPPPPVLACPQARASGKCFCIMLKFSHVADASERCFHLTSTYKTALFPFLTKRRSSTASSISSVASRSAALVVA